jgi:hypothetical protein
VEVVRLAVEQVVLVELEAVALVVLLVLQVAQQTLVVEAVAVITPILAVLAVLVLSSCPFQLQNTQAQPQAHQLSQPMVHTQF